MHVPSLWSALVVFLSRVQAGLPARDCEGVKYTTINDPRRSTAYSQTYKLCDKGLIRDNGWYRFSSEAGGEIPTATKIPKFKHCGTYAPIYIKGVYPSVEENTVNRTACAVYPYDPCHEPFTIKVRNCSGFYIYQLKPPTDCTSAYCAGSKLVNCTNSRQENCLKNRSPYITMPKRLYALEGSDFHWLFNATDPRGYPLEFGHESSNRTDMSVTVNETHKIITISGAKSDNVTLKVTVVAERTIITHTIQIVAIPYTCQNGGTRNSNQNVSVKREDVSNITCICVKPYSGQFCEKSPCDGFPCFPGLKCIFKADSYQCQPCPPRFVGNGKNCRLLGKEDTVKVEGEFDIVSGLKWQAELSDNTSFLYKQRTTEIVTEIMKIYKDTKEFIHVVVTGYRKDRNAVVVDFQMVLNKKMDEPLKLLKTHLENSEGNLGSFKVDAKTIKEKQSSGSSSDDDSYFGLHKTAFIIIVCIVSVLAVTAIAVCAICMKKKKISIIVLSMTEGRRERESSNNNPAPSAPPRPTKRNQVMDLHSLTASTA